MKQRDIDYENDSGGYYTDNDTIAAQIAEYRENQVSMAVIWGNISRAVIIMYVFLGGGYEVFAGIVHHHIQVSFIFSLMSALIFVCRVFYAHYSEATKTIWADVCGIVIMLTLSVLHVVINGTFL